MHATQIQPDASARRDADESAAPWKSCPPPAGLGNRQRFLNACRCRPVDHPPIWLMRQAGRCLPEYRALREKYSFHELIRTPELAAEVTLQPVRRFDFDAAILFSDILVVPEALGQPFNFRDAGGVEMNFQLRTAQDIAKLACDRVTEELAYVPPILRAIKTELAGRTALLGFAGSPWTLANFMLEGGSAREFAKARELFHADRGLFNSLCEKLTEAVTIFLKMQIAAGADAVQIFDSHGGLLPADDFEAASGCWIKRIIASLGGRVPVIVFSKGMNSNWPALVATGADMLGVDWTVPLVNLRRQLPGGVGIQGNLDPALLVSGTPESVGAGAARLLTEMRGRNGYIFNLGHGVPPAARLENIASLVNTVRSFV